MLNVPVWKLHPCKTSEVLGVVESSLGGVKDEDVLVLYWSLYKKVVLGC